MNLRALICCVFGQFIATSIAQSATSLVVGNAVVLPNAGQSSTMNAAAGDLNGDGLLDVVIGKNFSSPVVYYGSGGATPFASSVGHVISSDVQQEALPIDVNGDGRLDIVGVGFNGSTKVYINNGSNNPFVGVTGLAVGSVLNDPTAMVAAGDVNGDGRVDVALTNTNHIVNRLYLNTGNANPFGGATALPLGTDSGYGQDIHLVDVNGDGRLDAVIAYIVASSIPTDPSGINIFLNNGTANPFLNVQPFQLLAGKTVLATTVADFNRDGRTDLVATSTGSPRNTYFLNSGSATQPYGSPLTLAEPAGLGPSCLGAASADINRDGFMDVAITCGTSVSIPSQGAMMGLIYLNTGAADPFATTIATHVPGVAPPLNSFTRSAQLVPLAGAGTIALLVADDAVQPAKYLPLIMDTNPIAANDAASISTGTTLDFDVLANDIDADGHLVRTSLAITLLPSHGTARINTSDNTIIYQPDAGYAGPDSLAYTVRDNLAVTSNVGTLAISVQALPIANNDVAVTQQGQAITVNVLSNDASGGGSLDRSTLTVVAQPTRGTATVNTADGTVNYQPGSGFSGTDVFQYSVRDNLGAVSGFASVTVTVNATATAAAGGGGGGGATDSWFMLALLALLATRAVLRRQA